MARPGRRPDHQRRARPDGLSLTAALVAALTLLPLGFIVVWSVRTGPRQAWDLLVRPRIGELLANTVGLSILCMASCAVLGVGLALLVERAHLPVKGLWHGLLVAPLAVPAFVNSYAWVSLGDLHGFWAAFWVITLSYYPLVYLPVLAVLRGLDPALEETAWSLGNSRAATVARVVLPQLLPGLLGGCLLVGLHLLAEFGALQLLRVPTFTTAIYDQYGSTFNGSAATMMASVLVLLCLVLLLAELRLRGTHRLARVGQGVRRRTPPRPLGRALAPALLGLGVWVAMAVGVPLYALAHWFMVGTSAELPVGPIVRATLTTALLAGLGAVAVTVCALPVAWLAVRRPSRWSTWLERSSYVGNALPGIVVALALVTLSLDLVPGIYQTVVLLLAAYVILFLPRAAVSIRAGLAQAPPVLEDVGASLGLGPVARFRRIVAPLLAPSLGAGTALVFLAISTELTATLMLAPIGTHTLATEFWSASSDLRYGAAAPYAVLLVLISVPATLLLVKQEDVHR